MNAPLNRRYFRWLAAGLLWLSGVDCENEVQQPAPATAVSKPRADQADPLARAWEEARATDTIEAYVKFTVRHGGSNYSGDVMERLHILWRQLVPNEPSCSLRADMT